MFYQSISRWYGLWVVGPPLRPFFERPVSSERRADPFRQALQITFQTRCRLSRSISIIANPALYASHKIAAMQRGHATRPCIAAIHRGVILQRPPEDVFSPEQTNLNARQLHAAACWLEVRFFVGTIALNPETGSTKPRNLNLELVADIDFTQACMKPAGCDEITRAQFNEACEPGDLFIDPIHHFRCAEILSALSIDP